MPLTGSFEFTVDDETQMVSAGQALVVPRWLRTPVPSVGQPMEAVVAMLLPMLWLAFRASTEPTPCPGPCETRTCRSPAAYAESVLTLSTAI